MAKRIKQMEQKLRHNCPSCQASYTLLETHLTRKDLTNCQANCRKTWEKIITKFCQEKVLGAELEAENKEPIFETCYYPNCNEKAVETRTQSHLPNKEAGTFCLEHMKWKYDHGSN